MPDLEELCAPPLTLFKTADPIDLNCFGIAPHAERKHCASPTEMRTLSTTDCPHTSQGDKLNDIHPHPLYF